MSWIDAFFVAFNQIAVAGSPVVLGENTRTLNFVSGATAAYNSSTQSVDITVQAVVFASPWVQVTSAQSPYACTTSQFKFLVDATGGAVTLDLVPLGDNAVFIVKDWKGQSATHNITLAAPSGWTIESASSPGTFGATSVIATNGASVAYQFVLSLQQIVLWVLP